MVVVAVVDVDGTPAVVIGDDVGEVSVLVGVVAVIVVISGSGGLVINVTMEVE